MACGVKALWVGVSATSPDILGGACGVGIDVTLLSLRTLSGLGSGVRVIVPLIELKLWDKADWLRGGGGGENMSFSTSVVRFSTSS